MADETRAPEPAGRQPDAEPDRTAQPVDAEQPPRLPFPVVGVGASAGGLEAFSAFLDAMRPDSGMAFVLVLHLPPNVESHLAEVLARRTAMPVSQVADGAAVEPDRVYVIRPGHVLTIRDGRLHLGPELGGPRAANRPVDDFFRSLAEEQRERAVCVVLSGMGSNGTAGAQAVKAVGGLCVAQDPDSAAYPSMPRHLIDAGYADYIARPADLPDILLSYAASHYATGGREADAAEALRRDQGHLREILAILRTRTKQDFSGYKKPTVLRRVQRRMGLTRVRGLAEYAKLMRQSPTEVTALADDLLIHVTGFFRDPEAWDTLREKVVVPLVQAREAGAPVRAWVTACSSGEEAYSLAMLLTEESERAGKRLDVKVFATDLAERSLAHARAGVYPGGIESEVSPERLARFFARDDEMYRVRQDLRDKVVFAPQNVLQDPPFSRLDIASCRNLLIYLEPEVQHRVLALLHFGLREGGALFLGTSETVTGAEELYEPIDKKARIYRRVGPTRHGLSEFPFPRAIPAGAPAAAPAPRPDAPRPAVAELTRQTLLAWHTPAAVTTDRDHHVLYHHGDTSPFLRQPQGEPTRDLLMLARDGVRAAVRVALHRAAADGKPVTAPDGWVETAPDRRVRVRVTASPVLDPGGSGPPDYFVVSFEEREGVAPPTAPTGGEGTADEVRRLQGELQSTIEELQTSNEELKASHEEAMSVNEELQSANEELETSKEEMQSLNEELRTVNAQLRVKMEEHQAAAGDLGSLLASTDIAVLFLDREFRIRRFTPAVRDLLDLIPGDVGRPLAALARKFTDPNLDDDCRAVLERLVPVAREVPGAGGRHFLRRVLPYRTADDRIDGVVVTFVDVTDRKRAEEALAAEKEYAESIVETLHEPLLVLHPDLTVKSVNPAFYTHFRVNPADTIGRKVYDLGNRQWNIPELRTLLEDVLPDSKVFNDYEVTHEFEDLGRRVMLVNGRRLDHVQLILLGIRDITERKRAEEAVRASEERNALLVRFSDEVRGLSDPGPVAVAACRLLTERLGADRTLWAGVDPVAREYVAEFAHPPAAPTRWPLDPLQPFAAEHLAGRTVVYDDAATDPRIPDAARAEMAERGIGSGVAVPVLVAGVLRGVLNTGQRAAPRRWRPEEVALVEALAGRAWAEIERARAEAALRASEAKYRTLFEAIDEGFALFEMIYDAAGTAADFRYVETNPAFERQAGRRPRPGQTMRELFPEAEDMWLAAYAEVDRTGVPKRFVDRAPGLGRWYDVFVFPAASAGGGRLAAVFRDVTAERQAEAALRASEERQAFLLKLSDTLRGETEARRIERAALDLLAARLSVDRAYITTADYEKGENVVPAEVRRGELPPLVGVFRHADFPESARSVNEGTLVIEDVAGDPRLSDVNRQSFAAIKIGSLIGVGLRKSDGDVFWTLAVAMAGPRKWAPLEVALMEDAAERVLSAVGRADAEAALRASEERYRALVESQVEMVAQFRPDGTLLFVNEAYGRAFGKSPRELIGTSFWDLIPAEEHAGVRAQLGALTPESPVIQVENLVAAADGPRWTLWTNRALAFDAAGRVTEAQSAGVDITDRKRAEAALRASEEKYKTLFDSMDEAYAVVEMIRDEAGGRWADFRFVEVNPAFVKHTGMEYPVGKTATQLLGTPNPRWAEVYGRVADTGEPMRLEEREPALDRVFDLYLFRLGGPGSRRVAVLFTNVTDRKRAAEALRESEERLRLAVAVGGLGTWDWDIPTGRVVWNDEHFAMQGYAVGEVAPSYEAWLARVHPDDRAGAEAALAAARAARAPYYHDFRTRHPDGTTRWLSARGSFFYDEAGAAVRMIGVVRDVTEQQEAGEAVRRGQEQLREALVAARMGVWTLDPEAGTQTRDANLNRLLGLAPVESTQPFAEFLARVHPDDRAAVAAAFAASDRERRPLALEFRVVRPDGSVRWLRDQGDVFGDDGGRLMTGACADVTDRRAAEEAVRASEERLRRIVEGATDYAILTLSPDRAVTSWSPGAEAAFGWPAAEMLGRSGDDIFTPEDRAAGVPQGEAETARRTGRAADERWHVRKDGTRFWASGVANPLGPGGALGFVKVLRDLTDRKRVADALQQAREELERRVAERTAELSAALDSLEAEIARRADLARRLETAQEAERRRVARDLHDTVGQTLTGLSLAAAGGRLDQARELADRLARELHEVAVRLRPTALDDVGLAAAVGVLVDEWARQAGVPVEFQAVGAEAGRLPAEVETALYRVVQEGLTNAAKHAGARAVSVIVGRRDGEAVAVVEDDGAGFDPAGVRTPTPGKRGGLGLAGMRERVGLLGGTVEVESEPGRGTTVIARIPVPAAGPGA